MALLTTQTHDAKRSADVRARIGALSSMTDAWRIHVERWMEITAALREGGAPDDVERYFIFQTLAGAWPIEDAAHAGLHGEGAARSQAQHRLGRRQPGVGAGGGALRRRSCTATSASATTSGPFVRDLAVAGDRAAHGQLVLKLTVPGIPDIYQGDELAFRALVDPDNRRPVDWDWRQAMLRRLMGGSPPDAATRKLFSPCACSACVDAGTSCSPVDMSRWTPAPTRARSYADRACSWSSCCATPG